MRIDSVLYRLRFFKSRSLAQKSIEQGHVRCNSARVTRTSQPIAEGDVLTFPIGPAVRVVEIRTLPKRRGPAEEARSCYRVLDPAAQTDIAAGTGSASKGNTPQ